MKSLVLFFLSSVLCLNVLCLNVEAFSPLNVPLSRRGTSSTTSLEASKKGGVVITGSAGGVGFAYAGEFMDRGYDVVICDVKDCTNAARALTARHPNGKVYHTKCDVSDVTSVQNLGDFAKKNLGTVTHWINNAGINGGRRDLRDVPYSQVELVVRVNLIGILLCTKVAMEIMGEQAGVTGHIFNTGKYTFSKECCSLIPEFCVCWFHYFFTYTRHRDCVSPFFSLCDSRIGCQGRWDARICLLWCNEAWITTIDR